LCSPESLSYRSFLLRKRPTRSFWADRPRAGRWQGSRGRRLGARPWRHERPRCRRSQASRGTRPRRIWSDPWRFRSRVLRCSGVVQSRTDSRLATIAIGRQISRVRFHAYRAGPRFPSETGSPAASTRAWRRRRCCIETIVSVTASPSSCTIPKGADKFRRTETIASRIQSRMEILASDGSLFRSRRQIRVTRRSSSSNAFAYSGVSRRSPWRWFQAAVSSLI
jgi:hypothetical protein